METKDERGDPGSLKTLIPISPPPYPFLINHFWNFPVLHSAALGSFSGYENPWTLCIFSADIMSHFTNVERGVGFTVTISLHSLFA